jgi:hypothetical protein
MEEYCIGRQGMMHKECREGEVEEQGRNKATRKNKTNKKRRR